MPDPSYSAAFGEVIASRLPLRLNAAECLYASDWRHTFALAVLETRNHESMAANVQLRKAVLIMD